MHGTQSVSQPCQVTGTSCTFFFGPVARQSAAAIPLARTCFCCTERWVVSIRLQVATYQTYGQAQVAIQSMHRRQHVLGQPLTQARLIRRRGLGAMNMHANLIHVAKTQNSEPVSQHHLSGWLPAARLGDLMRYWLLHALHTLSCFRSRYCGCSISRSQTHMHAWKRVSRPAGASICDQTDAKQDTCLSCSARQLKSHKHQKRLVGTNSD